MSIVINGLSVSYTKEAEPALRDISLEVEPGCIVLLSGPCGSGKTTLLHGINGVVPNLFGDDYQGSVSIYGKEVSRLPLGETGSLVGTVLQDPESQIFNLKVADEIAFGCANLAYDTERIEKRINQQCGYFGLLPDGGTANLSGGQKQRLVIASVLAMDQPVLLLDEPLAHLDKAGVTILLKLLDESRAAGRTVLISEHRLDLILPHADRVLWLEKGRLVFDFTPDEAKEKLPRLQGLEAGEMAESRDNAPLVELLGVGVKGISRDRLQDVDLKVKQGENLALLGQNGAGKTTLLRTLTGLQKPNRGKVERRALKPGKELAYVFQNPGYQLFMESVRAEVGIGSPSEERTDKVMGLFGLDDLAPRHPHSLSEGQKRLLSIAAAVAPEPTLLCLDEPTVGQDHRSLQSLMAALGQSLDPSGTALVIATHDPRCALEMADRAIWLEEGRIVAHGGEEMIAEYFQAERNPDEEQQ